MDPCKDPIWILTWISIWILHDPFMDPYMDPCTDTEWILVRILYVGFGSGACNHPFLQDGVWRAVPLYRIFVSEDLEVFCVRFLVWLWGASVVRAGPAGLQ